MIKKFYFLSLIITVLELLTVSYVDASDDNYNTEEIGTVETAETESYVEKLTEITTRVPSVDEVSTSPKNNSLPTYFDLTDALNYQEFGEIENTMGYASHIYYSTDRLITEILELEWVIDLLKANQSQSQSSSPPHLCLTIAFQMTINRSSLNWRQIESILSTDTAAKNQPSSLAQHLCGVVLDFQLGSPYNETNVDHASFQYLSKWDISFTKFAKKFLNNIFEVDNVPVGVVYNEQQLKSDYKEVSEILLKQEIHQADFVIVNVDFSPVTRMPLTFPQFKDHFERLSQRNKLYLSRNSENDLEYSTNSIKPKSKVTYMVTWNTGIFIAMKEMVYEMPLFTGSKRSYLHLFQEFLRMTLKNKNSETPNVYISIISGLTFDLDNRRRLSFNEYPGRKIQHILPYLYVQDVDTTPCQLRTMLDKIAYPFDALVVNEFTWSGLARIEEKLGNPNENKCVNSDQPFRAPENILLFASRGIGAGWNKTKTAFKSLFENHRNIAGMNLTTIVFSADDLWIPQQHRVHDRYDPEVSTSNPSYYYSDYVYNTSPVPFTDSGITKFVESWVESNKIAIGCQVKISEEANWYRHELVRFLKNKCNPISSNSSLLVLTLEIDSVYNLAYNFSYETGERSMKKKMFNLLYAANIFRFHQKKVILNVVVSEKVFNESQTSKASCHPVLHHLTEFRHALAKWAEIHEIKLMFRPAFDLKSPMNGIWMPPKYNGTEDMSTRPLEC